jgi:LacI family transcriptional regulator, repressor for deo operon, udp, cdd, tsx, nupC, and nupG
VKKNPYVISSVEPVRNTLETNCAQNPNAKIGGLARRGANCLRQPFCQGHNGGVEDLVNPTIIEVARLAGVSNTTVSRCLNHPDKVGKRTLARVRKVIDEINFSPNMLAQSFRRGKTNIVLVVVHEIGSTLFSEIIEGIRSVLGGRYSLVLTESRNGLAEDNDFIDMLVAKQVEGVILLCSLLPFSKKLIEINKARRLPIVIGLEPLSDELNKLPSVHINNYQAAFDATDYLITLGHKDIVFVSGPKNSYATKDRELGFTKAMMRAGIKLSEASILHSDLTVNGGVNTANEVLRRPVLPSAIFCANDDMALGFMSAATKNGINIPDQLSIMGFDDMRYAGISNPPLSTVSQPSREIGINAAKRLLTAIETPNEDDRLVEILPHRLVIRQSTGPLR